MYIYKIIIFGKNIYIYIYIYKIIQFVQKIFLNTSAILMQIHVLI